MLKSFLKIKEIMMTDRVFIVSLLVGVVTLIGSVTFYKYTELQAMKSNIESAIVKGIDPVAVKCAYEDRSSNICIAYATSKK
jgi:uncharacterized membrane protein